MFYTYQKQLTETFCVNKDKPEMHCNGKCHLKSAFEKTEQQQQNNKANDVRESSFFFPVFYAESILQVPKKLDEISIFNFRVLALTASYTFTILHPPQNVA
ncbi:MAG: hypothetical protein LRY27_00890 [Chitinophagales bacterium]|nr:hypothetical protein [Chitinophagales bacterium]